VFSRTLIMLARKLPKTEQITLLYSSGRLFFDRLSIEATLAAGMATAKDGLLGSPGEPLAPISWGDATGPSTADARAGVVHTDRERLEHLARAGLMRPRPAIAALFLKVIA